MDVFSIAASITLNKDDYEKSLDDAGKKTSGFGDKLKSGLATAAKVGAAGLAVATTAVGALSKQALDGYASFEQLSGGVETLFKDSADVVMEYANNAYKTAGLSANQYMETVTSFSASLLQSLDGDTKKAAEAADMAITDMSDNANKMGTAIDSIQTAYQGFAKQNFTMLDNLKLGYGGTKEEMQRLLDKANEINAKQGIITDYQIGSYADIVNAIHVVQSEMGITGTTAAEASTTIEGSVASAKSAWENLVAGLGNENADLGQLTANLVNSVETAAENIIPRIAKIISGLGEAAKSLIGQVPGLQGVLSVIQSMIPVIATAAGGFAAFKAGMAIQGLVQGFQSAQVAISLLSAQIGSANLAQAALNGTMTVGETIVALLTGKMSLAALAQGAMAKAQNVLNAALNANPIGIIITIIGTLTAALVTLYMTNEDFRDKVQEIWGRIKEIFSGAWEFIKGVWDAVEPYFSTLWDGITKVFSAAKDFFGNVFSAAWGAISAIWDNAKGYFQNIWNTIKGIFSAVKSVLSGDFSGAWEAIKSVLAGWGDYFRDLWDTVKNIFSGVKDWFFDVGKNLLEGLWNGIKDKVEWLKGKVSGVVDTIKGWFTGKDGFDEHSPSKWSNQVFRYVMEGGGDGLEDGLPGLMKDVSNVVNKVKDGMNVSSQKYALEELGAAPTSIETGQVSFAESAAGVSSAAIANGISSAAAADGATIPLTINLLTGDGYKFASWVLPDLIKAADAAGTPIASTQYA